MSKMQNLKSKFRTSATWKRFRKHIMNKQKNIDPITKHKLYAKCNCHHCDLREENYKDLSDEEAFVVLNQKTHDFIHWGYKYYCEDKNFVQRCVSLWELMIEKSTK